MVTETLDVTDEETMSKSADPPSQLLIGLECPRPLFDLNHHRPDVGEDPVEDPKVTRGLNAHADRVVLDAFRAWVFRPATLYGLLALTRGLATGDLYGGTRAGDLSTVESLIDPRYRAKEDVFTLSAAALLSAMYALLTGRISSIDELFQSVQYVMSVPHNKLYTMLELPEQGLAVGVQVAHPDSLVIDIAGDASVLMTMQEMSTAVQYGLPIKIFILNNQYMGMVRQWQQLLHGNRLSESYTESLPDFVKLAEAYGAVGIRCERPGDLDGAIDEMIKVKRPVLFDCRVANLANCFPMIPSGKAHNEMLLGEDGPDEDIASAIGEDGKMLV